MHCPFCQYHDTKVVDSRITLPQNNIRRRRECPECNERFTTFETLQFTYPRVIKRAGYSCQFNEQKLKKGIMRALEKRAVSPEILEKLLDRIQCQICQEPSKEITSQRIGQIVLSQLRFVDEVAYIRFASVYLSFQNIDAFKTTISKLEDQ
ncbi:MAG: transcriptional regulator NrdR [Legionellales bacterium]|nr:transcriptional regulator NrdR [Legionellales bacterium]OUX67663.1 MAG: transcriptional regulator NrdR [bacterium TMED178]|tara:strand:+ start:1451 stop:1903 length:453 start_codon:yes stop_codon:yes gene_type:complete